MTALQELLLSWMVTVLREDAMAESADLRPLLIEHLDQHRNEEPLFHVQSPRNHG